MTRQARGEGGSVEAKGRRQFSGVYYREEELRGCGLQMGVREESRMMRSVRVSPGQTTNQHLTMAPFQTYPVFTVKGEEGGFLPSPFW